MKKNQRASDLLRQLTKTTEENICLGAIFDKLGERAYGLILIFCALPSALPVSIIPGVAFILSIPIIIVAAQLTLAKKTLWLPKRINQVTIEKNKLSKTLDKALPYLIKCERWLKPRLAVMTSKFFEVLIGLTIMVLALLLMLPIPFSNFIFSMLIVIFSLGLLEKDGVYIITGWLGCILYAVFAYELIMVMIHTLSSHA